jgi:hypothetical protein
MPGKPRILILVLRERNFKGADTYHLNVTGKNVPFGKSRLWRGTITLLFNSV